LVTSLRIENEITLNRLDLTELLQQLWEDNLDLDKFRGHQLLADSQAFLELGPAANICLYQTVQVQVELCWPAVCPKLPYQPDV